MVDQVQQQKWAPELGFYFKGNKSQFDFNAGAIEKFDRTEDLLRAEDNCSGLKVVT